jgi:hypothetical protein
MTRLVKDPGAMSPKERLAELGSIFATGLRRMQISREKALADGGDAERPCLSVNTPESPDDQEVA